MMSFQPLVRPTMSWQLIRFRLVMRYRTLRAACTVGKSPLRIGNAKGIWTPESKLFPTWETGAWPHKLLGNANPLYKLQFP